MPKFYGQNKKRIDPRYFLDETTNRDGDIDDDGDVDIDDVAAVVDQAKSATDEIPPGLERGYFGGPEFTDETLTRFREALIKAGWQSARGDFFIGKMTAADCADGYANYCSSNVIAKALISIPMINQYFKRGDVKYNQSLVDSLQHKPLSLDLDRVGQERIGSQSTGHDIGELVTRYMETTETGRGIDPRAKGLQREPYSPKGGTSAYDKMMSKYS